MAQMINELRSNLRVRVGLALAIAILGIYGLLEWRDSGQSRMDAYRQLLAQVARLGKQQSQTEWPARAEEAKLGLLSAEQRLWRNSSIGLAQAELQDWLYALLRQADAKSFTVKLTEGEAGFGASNVSDTMPVALAGLRQLRARIDLNADTPVMLALLAAMNDAEHQIIVDTLNVKGSRLELGLTVWFDLRAQSAAAGSASPPLVPAQKALPTPSSK